MLKARETDTLVVARSVRDNEWIMRPNYTLKLPEMEAKGASAEEIYAMIDSERTNRVALQGDLNAGVLHCGQVVGLVDRILTVKEVIDNIMSQAQEIRRRLDSQVPISS